MNKEELIVHAAASQIDLDGKDLPKHIQWMPPGDQIVQPMGFDEPFEMRVTPAIAAAANKQLQQLRGKAAAGKDAEPYGDFNHKDEGRSYIPKRFWWGGDDEKSGGIRVDVEWTGAGAKAVRDGELCCNSPSWVLNKVTKAFLGITHNVGGLVPRSAFTGIQAFAKAETISDRNGGPGVHQHKTSTTSVMDDTEKKQLADCVTAVAEMKKSLDTLVANAKASATADDKEKKEDAAIIDLRKQLKEIKDAQTASAKATAEALVLEHGKGRIPLQDKETVEFWVGAVAANAKAIDQLKKMPVNPALQKIVTSASAGGTTTSAAAQDEHAFVAKAKEYAKAHNITDAIEAQAKFAGTAEGKDLYAQYRESLVAK